MAAGTRCTEKQIQTDTSKTEKKKHVNYSTCPKMKLKMRRTTWRSNIQPNKSDLRNQLKSRKIKNTNKDLDKYILDKNITYQEISDLIDENVIIFDPSPKVGQHLAGRSQGIKIINRDDKKG